MALQLLVEGAREDDRVLPQARLAGVVLVQVAEEHAFLDDRVLLETDRTAPVRFAGPDELEPAGGDPHRLLADALVVLAAGVRAHHPHPGIHRRAEPDDTGVGLQGLGLQPEQDQPARSPVGHAELVLLAVVVEGAGLDGHRAGMSGTLRSHSRCCWRRRRCGREMTQKPE